MSAICFTVGAALPLLSAAFIMEPNLRLGILAGATTRECCLVGARAGVLRAGSSGHLSLPFASASAGACIDPTPPGLPLSPLPAVGLCFFGFLGAFLGGANVFRGGVRVVIGGWIALGIVYGIGRALNVDTA